MEQRTFIIRNYLRITDPYIQHRRMTYPPERGFPENLYDGWPNFELIYDPTYIIYTFVDNKFSRPIMTTNPDIDQNVTELKYPFRHQSTLTTHWYQLQHDQSFKSSKNKDGKWRK